MPTLALRPAVAATLVPIVTASLLVGPVPRPWLLAAEPAAWPHPGRVAGRLALLVVPSPDITPAAAAALRARLAARLEAEGRSIVAGRDPAPPERATLEAVRTALAAGLAAYEALDAATARDRLEAVTAALEADDRLRDAAPELLDAPLYLGLVALGLGDRPGALRALERAIRLDPARPLPPGRFSPAAEEAYALARIRLSAVRPSLLRIAATPEAVDLFVDGVYRGRTPLAVDPLVPGRHRLLAQAPGVGISTRDLVATALGPDLLELAVPADGGAPSLVALAGMLDAAEPLSAPAPAAGRRLADALGAAHLLLVRVDGAMEGFRAAAGLLDLEGSGWLARGLAGSAAEAAALGDRVADWLEAAARRPVVSVEGASLIPDWRDAAAGRGKVPGDTGDPGGVPADAASGAPAAADREPAEGRPWYRQWYIWLLIGAGIAVGVAAAAGGGGGGGNGTGSVSVAGN